MAAELGLEVTDTDEEADKSDVVAWEPKRMIMFLFRQEGLRLSAAQPLRA
jgi:hypothetical protein